MELKGRMLLGCLVFLIGSACFFYPDFREWRTQQEVEQIIENFSQKDIVPDEKSEWPQRTENTEGRESMSSGVSQGMLSDVLQDIEFQKLYDEMRNYNERLAENGQQIVDAWSYEQIPMDLSSLPEENGAIGYIEIPDMKVCLPLFLGASGENLAKGAAVLSETSMPIGGENTNCVIAGHRGYHGSAYFQYIENMQEGSFVYVTNPWETLKYQVTDKKIIAPDDVSSILIQNGRDMLTLFSCHPYAGGGAYRYVVFCERAGKKDESNSDAAKKSGAEASISTGAGTEEISESGIRQDSVSNRRGWEDDVLSDSNFIIWEGRLRVGLPLLTFLLSAAVIVSRYTKNKDNRKSEQ